MTKALSGKTMLAGVMGWPVAHSKSPRLHGFWLQQHKIDGAYVPLSVHPENLEKALRSLPVLGFRGVNLTIPHKELAMSTVDHIDPVALRVGAANTIVVREDGSLEGRNTDAFGFSENLKMGGFNQTSFSVTVLGAGGAARAVVVALQDMGAKDIRIVNRDRERAEKLCADLSGLNSFSAYGWAGASAALNGANLLINATSLGMKGQPPLDVDLGALSKAAFVADIVYAPVETDLLRRAKKGGHKIIDGLGMLLHQAVPGFEAWFGQRPVVTDALRAFVLEEK